MKISSIDKDINAILGSGYYQIPRFQRPYSWDRENVEEFWNDSIVETDNEHFIGSIVVYKVDANTSGLVDGQQRLTTITMILCALRDALSDQGFKNQAKGIHLLVEKPDINNKEQFVLQTETSYPYLQEMIQKFGPSEEKIRLGEEEGQLKDAYKLIKENVQTVVDAIKSDRSNSAKKKKAKILSKLSEIRDRILRLKLIFIELDDEDDAYYIFETLNTRGKDLRVTDLVKNHLVKLWKPSNAKVDLPKERWNSLVELIEESSADLSFDSFLHHVWLSRYDYITVKKLFKAIRKQVTRDNAKSFLTSLESDARVYREIHETAYGKWSRADSRIRQSIDALSLFLVKQDLPMIVSIMRDYRAGDLPKRHVERALNAIECFHFMFTAVTSQRSSGGISFMYALHARQLSKAKKLQDKIVAIDNLIKKLRAKRPSYGEFEVNFLDIRYSRKLTRQKKLVQYILSRMDQSLRTNGVAVDYGQMTLEHLAPENPHVGAKTFKSEIVASIGNLALVDQALNERLANKDFTQKKKALLKSAIWIDDPLKTAIKWDEKVILKRARQLAKVAYNNVWKF